MLDVLRRRRRRKTPAENLSCRVSRWRPTAGVCVYEINICYTRLRDEKYARVIRGRVDGNSRKVSLRDFSVHSAVIFPTKRKRISRCSGYLRIEKSAKSSERETSKENGSTRPGKTRVCLRAQHRKHDLPACEKRVSCLRDKER